MRIQLVGALHYQQHIIPLLLEQIEEDSVTYFIQIYVYEIIVLGKTKPPPGKAFYY